MRYDAQCIMIDTAPTAVYGFVADPANLPRWAVGFAEAVRQDEDGRWIVQTAGGDVPVEVEAGDRTGVVDFHLEPAPGVRVTAYSRVVAAGAGALYAFIQAQPEGMPDEVFDAQVGAVGHELVALKAILEVACPIGR
jgi:hypothetical protein